MTWTPSPSTLCDRLAVRERLTPLVETAVLSVIATALSDGLDVGNWYEPVPETYTPKVVRTLRPDGASEYDCLIGPNGSGWARVRSTEMQDGNTSTG